MIEITEHTTDESTGNISVSFRIHKDCEGVFKWTRHRAAEHIRSAGVKVGDIISGEDVCNKPNFPSNYVFTFKPVKTKTQKTVDKAEEKVTLKKTRSRKAKNTTGG